MELRNASVKLPADLHQQIKDELEAKNITMSQFFEMAAKEHFDKEKGGKTMANGRTLAFTVSEELFQRVKEQHLRRPVHHTTGWKRCVWCGYACV